MQSALQQAGRRVHAKLDTKIRTPLIAIAGQLMGTRRANIKDWAQQTVTKNYIARQHESEIEHLPLHCIVYDAFLSLEKCLE